LNTAEPQSPPADPQSLLALVGREHATLGELFAARASRTPQRLFLLYGGRRCSYGEAYSEIRRSAAFLQGFRRAADRPLRVASFLPNCPEALWAWFGAMALGAVYIPLNRHHKGMLLREQLQRTGADVLLTDALGAAMVHEALVLPMPLVVVATPLPGSQDVPTDGEPPHLGREYVDRAVPVVDEQLQHAGVRLAMILNR